MAQPHKCPSCHKLFNGHGNMLSHIRQKVLCQWVLKKLEQNDPDSDPVDLKDVEESHNHDSSTDEDSDYESEEEEPIHSPITDENEDTFQKAVESVLNEDPPEEAPPSLRFTSAKKAEAQAQAERPDTIFTKKYPHAGEVVWQTRK
ncbi:hypothetical protein FRC02_002188 [Tulasnella sp. 418]|nr:hypothetical protein FRC02_002188 [Tulasnella sp. 418]